MTPSHEPSHAALLDEQWARHAPSKAARAALAARAISELPEDRHAPWGARVAACLLELSAFSLASPLSPDNAPPGETNSALAHSLSWALLALAGGSASLEACMEALRSLESAEGSLGNVPVGARSSFLAPALAHAALDRMALGQRHDLMEEIFSMGYKPSARHLAEWLCHGGSIMDHPQLALRARAVLEDPRPGSDSQALAAQGFPHEFYCCPHPAWRQSMVASFCGGEPTLLQLSNLLHMQGVARQVAAASPETLAPKSRAENGGRPDAAPAKRAGPSLDDGTRQAARMILDSARSAYRGRLALFAESDPAAAAQLLMETMPPGKGLADAWTEAGLSTVDAAAFLFKPFAPFPARGVATHRGKGKIWPLADDGSKSNASRAQGTRLAYLDCLALSGASRAALQSEVERGARPSLGLAKALDIPAVARKFSEADALWMCSFVGHPREPKARRVLKV